MEQRLNSALVLSSILPIVTRDKLHEKIQSQFKFLFTITAAGVVPCGGPKKSPRTSSIVQVIFSFWSFEISEDILRNQKYFIG